MAKINILYLSYERNVDLADQNNLMYLDASMKEKDGTYHKEIYDAILMFKPDILIEREHNDGKAKYPEIIKFVGENFPNCIKCVWFIDNHCNFDWHKEYAPLFDYVFVAISKYRPILAAHLKSIGSKTKVFWLPVCYPGRTSKIKRNKSRVPFDIVFVGRWDGFFKKRTELIHKLQEKYKELFFPITDYANMEEYIRQGIISFNCSLAEDMNFRVWETIANGVELVTDDVPDLHLIHGLIERINIYKDENELYKEIDKILDCHLEHDVIRTQIWVQNHHALIHRHKAILEMIKNDIQKEF